MEEEIIRSPSGRAHGYLASPLSEHISEMPDGSLLVVGCPVARTGVQEYAVRDLPQELAKELGIDTSRQGAMIDLFRRPEDVFAPAFLASLNGRAICDGHPPGFVNPENFTQYAQGHIQNARKGPEPLEDGEWPIVADMVISAEPLRSKVLHKQARQVSLGYDYSIERDGDRIVQVDMVGNHAAIVPKGRAGDLVAIGDQAHQDQLTRAAPPEPAAMPPGSGNGHAVQNINAPSTKREKLKVKNNLLHLLGLGLKARANDADTDPEELAQAALDIGELPEANDKKRRARDLDPEIEVTHQVRDLDPEIEVTHTMDARRRRMHDMLEDMLDARDARARDTDLEELKGLITEFFDEEAKEPEHADMNTDEDVDPTELEEVIASEPIASEDEEEDGEDEEDIEDDADEVCAHCGEATDEESCPACGCREKMSAPDKATDRATAHDGAAATLRMLRPVIARTTDQAVRSAFNTASATLARRSVARDSNAGYGGFAAGARSRTAKLPRNVSGRARASDQAADANAKLQKYYDDRRKAGN